MTEYSYKNQKVIEESQVVIQYVNFYIISIFYDIEKNQMKIPEDMFECSRSNVLSTIRKILCDNEYGKAISIGREYMDKVYLENEETLLKY